MSVQNVAESEIAIIQGRGQLVDGRPCRTERAKVNLFTNFGVLLGSLYLSRTTGGPIREGEARYLLRNCGALEKVWYASDTDLEMFRLPEGIWVMFAYFQDCRDAHAVGQINLCGNQVSNST
jgi:RNA recognition motif-containing protein